MARDFDDLPNDPGLVLAASALREEWRLDEEEYARAAQQVWAHGRTLRDVLHELMLRGDRVGIDAGDATFTGTVVAVGDDYAQVETGRDAIDLCFGASPLLVRVTERVQAGGCRVEPGSRTFRARLLEHEVTGVELVVGLNAGRGELLGAIVVGRDQLRVARAGAEAFVPLREVAWVRPATASR